MTAFLDTNILIYAQGSGRKSEIARQAILAGGVISVQVLNEFAAVLRRKLRFEWDVIAEAVADVRIALDPVRPIDVAIHTEALALARSHGFSFYPAFLTNRAFGRSSSLQLCHTSFGWDENSLSCFSPTEKGHIPAMNKPSRHNPSLTNSSITPQL